MGSGKSESWRSARPAGLINLRRAGALPPDARPTELRAFWGTDGSLNFAVRGRNDDDSRKSLEQAVEAVEGHGFGQGSLKRALSQAIEALGPVQSGRVRVHTHYGAPIGLRLHGRTGAPEAPDGFEVETELGKNAPGETSPGELLLRAPAATDLTQLKALPSLDGDSLGKAIRAVDPGTEITVSNENQFWEGVSVLSERPRKRVSVRMLWGECPEPEDD